MTDTQRPQLATARGRLGSIANEAAVLVAQRGGGDTWNWIVVPRIRRLLDLSVDLLAEAAHDVGEDEPRGRRLLATRDDIAAHLRAADHVEAAKPGQSAHVGLLMRAADRLADEFDAPA